MSKRKYRATKIQDVDLTIALVEHLGGATRRGRDGAQWRLCRRGSRGLDQAGVSVFRAHPKRVHDAKWVHDAAEVYDRVPSLQTRRQPH